MSGNLPSVPAAEAWLNAVGASTPDGGFGDEVSADIAYQGLMANYAVGSAEAEMAALCEAWVLYPREVQRLADVALSIQGTSDRGLWMLLTCLAVVTS